MCLFNKYKNKKLSQTLFYLMHQRTNYYQQSQDPVVQEFDIKNQYSTFIEELEETTEKLMQQVFETEYQPQINIPEVSAKISKQRKQKQKETMKKYSGPQKAYKSNYQTQYEGEHLQIIQTNFDNFIQRNRKWCQQKEKNINAHKSKLKQEEERQITLIPQILRGSREKLDPIYERTLQLHSSKQKLRVFKQIEQKKKEEEQINSYSFHPKINEVSNPRTLKEYLKDKQQWVKKKNEAIQLKKLERDAKKYTQCLFSPQLISNQFSGSNFKTVARKQEKVEERLLKTLEKISVFK